MIKTKGKIIVKGKVKGRVNIKQYDGYIYDDYNVGMYKDGNMYRLVDLPTCTVITSQKTQKKVFEVFETQYLEELTKFRTSSLYKNYIVKTKKVKLF